MNGSEHAPGVPQLNDPRDHHVVPQFFLRHFAVDEARTKVNTLAKSGSRAVWKEPSIKGIGVEGDFYVHMVGGRPVSVETDINRSLETPISRSDTWAKITTGRSSDLAAKDRRILYSLVRHLETRTPHYRQTAEELAAMAVAPSSMPFADEEREMYAAMRASPGLASAMFNLMAVRSFADEYERSLVHVSRSSRPLRTSTTPVLCMPAPARPAIDLPLPGMVPFQRVLAVDPHTLVLVVVGDFGGAFANSEMPEEVADGFNRSLRWQFSYYSKVRHMICGREMLVEDMAWAGPWPAEGQSRQDSVQVQTRRATGVRGSATGGDAVSKINDEARQEARARIADIGRSLAPALEASARIPSLSLNCPGSSCPSLPALAPSLPPHPSDGARPWHPSTLSASSSGGR